MTIKQAVKWIKNREYGSKIPINVIISGVNVGKSKYPFIITASEK